MGSDLQIKIDDKIKRSQDVIHKEMDGDTVMMSVELGEYHGINPTGSRIWDMLKSPMMVSQICKTLEEEYAVEPERCRKEVLVFLNSLFEKRLIEIV